VTEHPHARRVGEVVGGKYRLVRFLAAGGMGTVFEAQHTVIKRRFAIKLLHAELAMQRESLARFQREAQAAGELESENVVAAIDFGIALDGSPYIVMEYLSGESLRTLVDRAGRLPITRATDMVMQACHGVAAAHKAGIIHRDINPQNLFVCRREDGTDRIKVLDFGIAKLEAVESAETRTGTILGTPAYLSPEQARGEKNVDHRTDVYGLGAVLYELLSGKKPHPGDSHNAILHHICTQPSIPLDAAPLGISVQLVENINRALSSDPNGRQNSVEELAQALAPWAKRDVWPAVSVVSDEGKDKPDADVTPSLVRGPARVLAKPLLLRRLLFALFAVMAVALLIGIGIVYRATRSTVYVRLERPLASAHFFVSPPNPGAIQQIAALVKTNATREAAAITAMASIPQAVWFSKGTPEEVRSEVGNTIIRAMQDRGIPVLVAHNRPYRDCAGFSAGGARDTAAYKAWIDGFASGIGNERAVVILEPDSIGGLPYYTRLNGALDWCRPTATNAKGNKVQAPGASAEEAFAQFNNAIEILRKKAPNALVYLDGTHSSWLTVGEISYRLWKSGVLGTQGFAVNVSNFRPTSHSIRYSTWISKCLYYATRLAKDAGSADAFRRCANQPISDDPTDENDWLQAEQWYTDNVDGAIPPALGGTLLAHFVIDTGRNGQKPLDLARYAAPPYDQPAAVIHELGSGAWCNPPGMGLGLRPTADTGVPLLDAYLWIKTVGESDGSCDIAGGARSWNYGKYNPWGITGDAQRHFDPLWGMVNPAAGTWFPEQALELAQKAEPSLLP
jgi:endoglucanase